MEVNRQQFLEDGYVILRQVIPPDQLDSMRQAYETLVDRQRAIWARDRKPDDPPGGSWETGAQPRLNLTTLADQIDAATAPAVEVWLHENTHGASSQLLGVDDAAVTEMMMMCSPARDRGPARWHRDFSPGQSSSVMGYAEDILDNGPRYVQWNLCLYDDEVLWVVPGSHVRTNTEHEDEQLRRDAQAPIDSGVQTHLQAGDGVAYILPILHWGSNYSTRIRRTIHGGYSLFTHYPDRRYFEHLSPPAQETFGRWQTRSEAALDAAETALRSALAGDGAAYHAALEAVHPGSGAMAKRQTTIFLSKSVRRIRALKDPGFDQLPDLERGYATGVHPMTMQWGVELAGRFTDEEAAALWDRFEWVDDCMQTDEEHSTPGFQGGPTRYLYNEVPDELTVDDLVARWRDAPTA
jgi:hypothetical protein